MTLGRFARCFTVGFVFAFIAIGLLPFLLISFLSDINGLTDMDATPLYSLLNKIINYTK